MTRVLITGGAGFIGHHVVDHLLRKTEWHITVLDRLDHSGNLNRLTQLSSFNRARVRFVYHDLRAPINPQLVQQLGYQSYILHLAAATHVDRSIEDPMSFVMNNVVGTCNLLDYARAIHPKRLLYFSTDEVFGPAAPGVFFKEDDRYRSGNPYAATKAGAEELCVAYHNTYQLPVIITHTMNVFGERQHPEKYIPLLVRHCLEGRRIYIHADPTKTIPGARTYIHAQNVADAVLFVLQHGAEGEKYNIVGEREVDNLTLAKMVGNLVGTPPVYRLADFHSSRPGHDLRYALDGSKLAALGWKPPEAFEEGLLHTVQWFLNHDSEWL